MNDEKLALASGLAALAVCEALALALVEGGVLSRQSASAALQEAVHMHRLSGDAGPGGDRHLVAAGLVEMIRKSVDLPQSAM